nr:Iron-sulfur assembly protein 1 [Polyrhizophydium stewartii]
MQPPLPPLPGLGVPVPPPHPPKASEGRRLRVLVAKQIPEDHFGKDGVYAAPGAKSIPLALVRHNTQSGPAKDSSGSLIEHTVLGEIDDFEELDKIYSKPELETSGDDSAVTIEAPQGNRKQVKVAVNAQQRQSGRAGLRSAEMTDERREWLNRLHIFQRYREVREEHALSNWKRHSIEWNRVEESIAKRTSKPAESLLMARLNEYRKFVEERDLIEEALLLLEEHNINFWKTGLRIGTDLLGLIERLRTYEQTGSRPHKRLIDYQLAKKRELRQVISHLDPFYGHDDSGYLEIVGHGINGEQNAKLTEAYMSRLDRRARGQTRDDDLFHGMRLVFSAKRLFFQVTLGEVSSSILTVHNRGTVSIHFEWVPVPHPNPLQVKATYDGIQRFYLSHTRGVILPGMAYDFPIIFKSASPGGLAIEEDVNKNKRNQIERMLRKRYAETVARETIESILRGIKTRPRSSMYEMDPNQSLFEQSNKEMNLMMAIPQADVRSAYIAKLNGLVQQSATAPLAPTTTVLYAICYDVFIELAGKIADASESMRRRLNLPLAVTARFFEVDEMLEEGIDVAAEAPGASNAGDPKKAAPAPAASVAAPAAKDAKKGAAAAPPAKPSEPAKKGGAVGKKPNEAPPAPEVEEAAHPVAAPKTATRKTPAAVSRLRQLTADPSGPKLLKVGTKKKGCSGQVYTLEYVSDTSRFDEVVEQDGVKVVIDSKALFSLIGSEMDFVEDALSAQFVFHNPNVKEMCGCGQSFVA